MAQWKRIEKLQAEPQGKPAALFGLNGTEPSVRLDAEESAALKHAVCDVPGEVWLFGSRTDLSRRGGDVDILVLTDQPALETSRTIATRFFSRCEEKIDVIVFDPAHMSSEQSDFLTRISKVRIA
jgi:hypothetical protein